MIVDFIVLVFVMVDNVILLCWWVLKCCVCGVFLFMLVLLLVVFVGGVGWWFGFGFGLLVVVLGVFGGIYDEVVVVFIEVGFVLS